MVRTRVLRQGIGGLALLFLVLALVGLIHGQPMNEARTITPQQRTAIVDSAARILADYYVFPDVGKRMGDHIRSQSRQGKYNEITVLPDFTRRLTEDVRSISKDLHLAITPLPPDAKPVAVGDSIGHEVERQQVLEEAERNNFGFVKVERIKGNIGYIKFNQFYPAEIGGATAIAAMNLVGHCDALIFDLRENGGGEPSMIQLITSYLFESPQLLNTFEVRGQERNDQYWSHAFVPGPRFPDVPVYVLTSQHTFSGAEEFSYNLKNLKRATIVGEVTGGGAHPVNFHPVYSLGVELKVPFGRAVNPISGTNWEGTGVKPDIECKADQALERAHWEALNILREKEVDHERRIALEWACEALAARLNPVTITPDRIESYVGTYGPRIITFENGEMYYARENGPKRKLIPITDQRFMLDGVDYFRLEFVRENSDKATEVVGYYDNGTTDHHLRTP